MSFGKNIFISMMATIVLSCFFYASPTLAADISMPSRNGLRLEMLSDGTLGDTSGNGRIISFTGVVPQLLIDTQANIPYAKFTGSGGYKVNTAWTANGTDDFTISMWTRIDPSVFSQENAGGWVTTNSVSVTNSSKNYTPYRYPTTLIFAKAGENDVMGFHLSVINTGKCSLRSTPESLQPLYPWTLGVYSDLPNAGYTYVNNYGYVRSGMFTSAQDLVDCSALLDNKWHSLIVRKSLGMMQVIIDDKISGSGITSAGSFFRSFVIGGGVPGTMDQAVYGHLPVNIQSKVITNHYFRGGLSALRVYSRALSDSEITGLNNELRYAQGLITSTGAIQLSIEKYTKPNLGFLIKGVPSNLKKDLVTYQYSLDGSNFLDIPSVSMLELSGSQLPVTYRTNLDMSNIGDGKITITLRIKNGQNFQNIGTISFDKFDKVYDIIINQPDSTSSSSKYITASADGGILSLSLTRGSVCDGSLIFDDYTELLFTSPEDNYTRICYKASFPVNGKTIYRLSLPISGITLNNQIVVGSSLFANYKTWPKSVYLKTNDSTYLTLELLGVSSGQSQGTINGVTMTDINGDGLVDFLYSRNDPIRRAILINNGDYTFKAVYKCALDSSVYYGDCADLSR